MNRSFFANLDCVVSYFLWWLSQNWSLFIYTLLVCYWKNVVCYFSSKNGPNLFKSYSWTEWVYFQYLNTTRWGSKIAKSKLQLKKVRGPKVKAVVKNHQKIFKVSFLVIILSSITSISWIITIKIVFNSNFVFMNPQPLHSFFKILKNYTYFRCTGLLHSSKLVHLDVKK